MNEVLLRPRPHEIKDACDEFDTENELLEESLRELFGQYPANIHRAQAFLKATTLNTLYFTQIPLYNPRIPTLFDLADHITGLLGIDSDLRSGSPHSVTRIATIDVEGKAHRYYYSFATKYCNWHNPNSYPIFDTRVFQYLWHLRNHDCLHKFRQNDLWDYPKFKSCVEEFRDKNGLTGFTFKHLDKFMYLQGRLLLDGRAERKIEVDGTILVPAPGNPGEMEPSVENYSSPEEAEQSRRRFTDSGGWVKKNEDGTSTLWDGEKWVPYNPPSSS